MNFFDAYDIPSTSTPPPTNQPQPSLNEEVTQVVGQLSRFWGGFRKQSRTAFEAARKDFGQVVQQAQKELTNLTAEAPPSAQEPASSATEQAASLPAEAEEASHVPSTSVNPDDASDKAIPKLDPSASTSQPQTQTLFSRLQASLPPSLVSAVQTQLPESMKETLEHARTGSSSLTALDFAQLRSTIASELQRVQGATEGYVHRSEELLREAGEFLKDAVKVVPPEEGDSGHPGLIWDGTDVWMLPTTSGATSPAPGSSTGKGKEKEIPDSRRPSMDTLRAVATRAESMLKQLKHDPEVLKADPNDDDNVHEMYVAWLGTEAASDDRGIGTTAWQNKIERALADAVDGAALQATMDTLVPETLTSDEFWTRYFFRVYQVEREEARRKAILQGPNETEDDFSWEDDEEESTSPTAKLATPPTTAAVMSEATTSAAYISVSTPDTKSRISTPGKLSPRQSSEYSYDVVSSQVSNNGAETDTIRLKPTEKAGTASGVEDENEEDEENEDAEEEGEDEDADADEDDEDEDDDEDEEKGDDTGSDWE